MPRTDAAAGRCFFAAALDRGGKSWYFYLAYFAARNKEGLCMRARKKRNNTVLLSVFVLLLAAVFFVAGFYSGRSSAPEGTAAGEGLEGLAAEDDGAAGGGPAEALEVVGDGDEQAVVLADAPIFGDVDNGVHGDASRQTATGIAHGKSW